MDGIGPSTVQQCREYEMELAVCGSLFPEVECAAWNTNNQGERNTQIQAAVVSFIQIHIFTNTKTDKEGEGNTYNPFITQIGVKRFISFGDLMHCSAFFSSKVVFA